MGELYKSTQSLGDPVPALSIAILALAQALDKKGVLSFQEYRVALVGIYEQLPDKDAGSTPGRILGGMLSELDEAISKRK